MIPETETERIPVMRLLRDLSDDVSKLVRQEVALAKAELQDKISRLARNAATLAVGIGILLAAAVFLFHAALYGVVALFTLFVPVAVAVWLGPLVLAVVLGAVGFVLFHKALRALSQERLSLPQTAESLQENKQWLKARMH
jgi:hypothetical protein